MKVFKRLGSVIRLYYIDQLDWS